MKGVLSEDEGGVHFCSDRDATNKTIMEWAKVC